MSSFIVCLFPLFFLVIFFMFFYSHILQVFQPKINFSHAKYTVVFFLKFLLYIFHFDQQTHQKLRFNSQQKGQRFILSFRSFGPIERKNYSNCLKKLKILGDKHKKIFHDEWINENVNCFMIHCNYIGNSCSYSFHSSCCKHKTIWLQAQTTCTWLSR